MNWTIFILGTIGIIIFSWLASIKDKRYHGVFRFFAFESIFIIVVLNIKVWFINPLSVLQILSWILLGTSIFLAGSGFYLLYKWGNPETKNAKTTTTLVREGIYKYIRHPLYTSLILGVLGAFLKKPSSIGLGLVVLTIISLFFTARVEENEVILKFGEAYKNYITKTKMFIPFIF